MRVPTRKTVRLTIADFSVTVHYKKIKNCYLRVKRPRGELEISAPIRTSDKFIADFVLRREPWIKRRLSAVKTAEANATDYADEGTLWLWGEPYKIRFEESAGTREKFFVDAGEAGVENERRIIFKISPLSSVEERRRLVAELYRAEVYHRLPFIVPRLENLVGKSASEWRVRNMKSRWGSCNVVTRKINLSLWLAAHKPDALEYVISHELTHLWVRGHGAPFNALMDIYYPRWREVRSELKEKIIG